jgi:hypothetical protein
LIRWLKDAKRGRPQRIDKAPEGAGAHVEPTFDAGSVILQRGDRLFALVWSKDDKDRRRALPPGEYRLRTTRLEGEKDGAWWFLSSTGPAKTVVRVAERGPTKFSIPGEVHFKACARRRGQKLQLGFAIFSAEHRGLSVYRDGKRVPVTYKVLDKMGKVIDEGRMNYG